MMGKDRLLRVNELLKREIGECVFRVINEADFDPGTITITRVRTAKDLCNATVMVSVRGAAERQRRALFLLRKYRVEIQRRINKDLFLKRTPRLCFALDTSLEEGDRVLALLEELGEVETEVVAEPLTEDAESQLGGEEVFFDGDDVLDEGGEPESPFS